MSFKTIPASTPTVAGGLDKQPPYEYALCFSVEPNGNIRGRFLDIYLTKKQAQILRDQLSEFLEVED